MATTKSNELDLTPPDNYADLQTWLAKNFGIIQDLLNTGIDVDDTFTTVDSKTVTVEQGIVKSIV